MAFGRAFAGVCSLLLMHSSTVHHCSPDFPCSRYHATPVRLEGTNIGRYYRRQPSPTPTVLHNDVMIRGSNIVATSRRIAQSRLPALAFGVDPVYDDGVSRGRGGGFQIWDADPMGGGNEDDDDEDDDHGGEGDFSRDSQGLSSVELPQGCGEERDGRALAYSLHLCCWVRNPGLS